MHIKKVNFIDWTMGQQLEPTEGGGDATAVLSRKLGELCKQEDCNSGSIMGHFLHYMSIHYSTAEEYAKLYPIYSVVFFNNIQNTLDVKFKIFKTQALMEEFLGEDQGIDLVIQVCKLHGRYPNTYGRYYGLINVADPRFVGVDGPNQVEKYHEFISKAHTLYRDTLKVLSTNMRTYNFLIQLEDWIFNHYSAQERHQFLNEAYAIVILVRANGFMDIELVYNLKELHSIGTDQADQDCMGIINIM